MRAGPLLIRASPTTHKTSSTSTCTLRHMRRHYAKRPEGTMIIRAGLRAVEKKQLPHMLRVANMLLHGTEDPGFVRHDNILARPHISWERNDRLDIVVTSPPFGGHEEDGIESNSPQHFRTRETTDLFLALITASPSRAAAPPWWRTAALVRRVLIRRPAPADASRRDRR
jgi:type I restriction-modification system DNA methylase subunit